jgi:hypothetical protein
VYCDYFLLLDGYSIEEK